MDRWDQLIGVYFRNICHVENSHNCVKNKGYLKGDHILESNRNIIQIISGFVFWQIVNNNNYNNFAIVFHYVD